MSSPSIDRRGSRLAPSDVRVLDPRVAGEREGYIERLARDGHKLRVELLLDDGRAGRALMEPEEAEWLELREGDIVALEVIAAPRPSRRPAGLSGRLARRLASPAR